MKTPHQVSQRSSRWSFDEAHAGLGTDRRSESPPRSRPAPGSRRAQTEKGRIPGTPSGIEPPRLSSLPREKGPPPGTSPWSYASMVMIFVGSFGYNSSMRLLQAPFPRLFYGSRQTPDIIFCHIFDGTTQRLERRILHSLNLIRRNIDASPHTYAPQGSWKRTPPWDATLKGISMGKVGVFHEN